jgi:hypothetical protein
MIDVLAPMIKQFLPFAKEKMGFKEPPRLFIREDEENAQNPLGKTAFYDPAAKSVTLYISDRHPKDVMRSLSHELVHHCQNCDGQFDNVGQMGDGYAQNDSHLREMERQAYEIGNLCFRDWEDSIKHTIYFEHLQKGVEKVMSTKDWKNGELKSLLSEAWGFKMDLSKLNEEWTGSGDDHMGDDTEEAKEETEGVNDPVTEGELDEMGCGDHGPEDEVVVMQSADEEGPDDPNAIVDELGDLVARLQAALGGMGGDSADGEEMVVDIQERFKKALKKALTETGAKRDGESAGDEGADGHEDEKDYSHGGDRKGDASETHSGKDYEKHHPHHKVHDDSEEKEHYEENAMSDDEHIKAIEHHLNALRKDRDYDDEKEEELDERRGRGRADPRLQRGPKDARARPMEEAIKIAVREAFRKSLVKK